VDGLPTITITYCTACNFTARAAWLAQELLHTFHDQVAGIMLVPGSGGVLDVSLDDRRIFSRQEAGRDPVIKELRDALYEALPGTGARPHGL
jgi:selenoprotein W-related protein